MASGKRASMREGPLADLFRRTEEQEDASGAPRPEAGAQDAEPREPRQPVVEQPPARQTPAVDPEPDVPEYRPAAEPARPTGEAPEDKPAAVPTPRERLRHAFSSDIPDNMLESEAPPEPQEPERYSGSSGDLYSPPAPVGSPSLRVVGVGGAGVNAVNRMVEAEIRGVEFIAVNTDLQSLQQCDAQVTLHIGAHATRGLGSGSDPVLGRQAEMEEYDMIKSLLKGEELVCVSVGAV